MIYKNTQYKIGDMYTVCSTMIYEIGVKHQTINQSMK